MKLKTKKNNKKTNGVVNKKNTKKKIIQKGGNIGIELRKCLLDDPSVFQSGSFISQIKFCRLLNNSGVNYMTFNFGESLIGTSFLSGTTLITSMKFMTLMFGLVVQNYHDTETVELITRTFLSPITTLSKEELIATSLICNDYYETLFNDLYYYILKYDKYDFLMDEGISEKIFLNQSKNFNPLFRWLDETGDKSEIDLNIFDDGYVDYGEELFEIMELAKKPDMFENEWEKIRLEIIKPFIDVDSSLFVKKDDPFISQTQPLQVFIFGLGPSGLIMAASFIKMAIKYEIFINLVLVESRIEYEGYKKEYSRKHKISINRPIDMYEYGPELLDNLFDSLDGKIETNYLERKLANFIQYFCDMTQGKEIDYKIQIRRLYRKSISFDSVKYFVNSGFMNLKKIPTIIFNCTSKGDALGDELVTEDERFRNIPTDKIKSINEEKKRIYLIGEEYYYYMKVKPHGEDDCNYLKFNRSCGNQQYYLHLMEYLAMYDNIFEGIDLQNKEEIITRVIRECKPPN